MITDFMSELFEEPRILVIFSLVSSLLLGLSIYLVIIWALARASEYEQNAKARIALHEDKGLFARKLGTFEKLELFFSPGTWQGNKTRTANSEIPQDKKSVGIAKKFFTSCYTYALECNINVSYAFFYRASAVCIAVASLFTGILTGSILIGCVTAVLFVVLGYLFLKARAEKQVSRMREQLPSFTRSLEVSLATGRSLPQALGDAAHEAKVPLKNKLELIVDEVTLGTPVPIALRNLQEQVPMRELELLISALIIQHKSGGSLHELFGDVSRAISDALDLTRSLKAKTAEARLSSRIVVCLPLVLFVLIGMVSPSYYNDFFESEVGITVFAIAIALDLLGLLFIRRLTKGIES